MHILTGSSELFWAQSSTQKRKAYLLPLWGLQIQHVHYVAYEEIKPDRIKRIFTQKIGLDYQPMNLYMTTSVSYDGVGWGGIPSCIPSTDFLCHPKGCCPSTSTGNSLIQFPSLLFMTDHLLILGWIIYRKTIGLLHSEELDLPKAIKWKEGGLIPSTVVLNLNEETILKELSHMDEVPQL